MCTIKVNSLNVFLFPFADFGACTTPKGHNGLCRPLRTCPVLLKIATKPVSPGKRKILQDLVCGTADGKPLICCSDDPMEENSEEMRIGKKSNSHRRGLK